VCVCVCVCVCCIVVLCMVEPTREGEGGRRAYLAKAEFSPCVFDEGFVILWREGDHNIWPESSHRERRGESRVKIIEGCICGK